MQQISTCQHHGEQIHHTGEIVVEVPSDPFATGQAALRGRRSYSVCSVCWPRREDAIDAMMKRAQEIRMQRMGDIELLNMLIKSEVYQGAPDLMEEA